LQAVYKVLRVATIIGTTLKFNLSPRAFTFILATSNTATATLAGTLKNSYTFRITTSRAATQVKV
jgi:hypothetical protein